MVDVPKVAVIVAVTVVSTVEVFTVNVVEVAPAGIVIVVGIVASAELELSVMVYPPAGAAPPRVTVPVEEDPPVTLVGFNVNELMLGVLISSETILTAPL